MATQGPTNGLTNNFFNRLRDWASPKKPSNTSNPDIDKAAHKALLPEAVALDKRQTTQPLQSKNLSSNDTSVCRQLFTDTQKKNLASARELLNGNNQDPTNQKPVLPAKTLTTKPRTIELRLARLQKVREERQKRAENLNSDNESTPAQPNSNSQGSVTETGNPDKRNDTPVASRRRPEQNLRQPGRTDNSIIRSRARGASGKRLPSKHSSPQPQGTTPMQPVFADNSKISNKSTDAPVRNLPSKHSDPKPQASTPIQTPKIQNPTVQRKELKSTELKEKRSVSNFKKTEPKGFFAKLRAFFNLFFCFFRKKSN